MDLSEFKQSVLPAVQVVLRGGIGLEAADEEFLETAVLMAMEESGGNQSIAARKLGVTQGFVSGVVNGKRLKRFRPRGKYDKAAK